jgi:hypothetical protein
VDVELQVFLSSALDGGEWSASRPGRFTPRERTLGTHWIGGWVVPRAVLHAVVKKNVKVVILIYLKSLSHYICVNNE